MDRRWWGTTVFLALLGAPGCDGDDDSILIEDLPAAAQEAVCAREVRCGQFPDTATCGAVLFFRMQALADVASGKVIYDGKAAAACLRAYGALGCKVSTLGTAPQSCDAAFKGTLADGAACLADEECVSRSCNTSTCNGVSCCLGVCESKAALGGACTDGGDCVDAAFCKRSPGAASGICASRLSAGQPCTGFDECVPGTFCLPANATAASQTCTPPPAEGQPCPDGFCDDSGDVCDAASGICVRRIAVGGSCPSAACVSYATCDPETMKCVAGVAAGGACSATATCIGDLPCDNGTCTAHPDEPACP